MIIYFFEIIENCTRFKTSSDLGDYLCSVSVAFENRSNFWDELIRRVWESAKDNKFELELCNYIEWNPFILDYCILFVDIFKNRVDIYASILRFSYLMKKNFEITGLVYLSYFIDNQEQFV